MRVLLADFVAPTGPERLLRVEGLSEVRRVPAADGAHFSAGDGVSATMVTGPWLAAADGRVSVGALGPLVDDVIGYGVELAEERWSVSTELGIAMVGEVPTDGSTLRAESWIEGVAGEDGVARAEVRDAGGRLVATAQARSRFGSPISEGGGRVPPSGAPGVPGAGTLGGPGTLVDLLGPGVVVSPGRLVARVEERFANPMGNLHGGVSLWWSELVAGLAVPAPAATASVRIHHVRGIPGGSEITFTATPEHRGRTIALVRVVSTDERGRVCAVASVALR